MGKDPKTTRELYEGVIDTALNYRSLLGKPLTHITVPRGFFLQLLKERDSRRRCAAVLKKTHKEMKRQKRMNDWGKDKGGRWSNDNGSLLQDDERRRFLSLMEARMDYYKFKEILSRETMLKIAEKHVRRFENLLSSDRHNIRVDECQHYLEIWSEAQNKLNHETFKPEELSQEALQELGDALSSGEYDGMLTEDEKSKMDAFYSELE